MPWFDTRSISRILNGINIVLNREQDQSEILLRMEVTQKRIEGKIDDLIALQRLESIMEQMQMASLDETLAKVTEANTKADSLIALVAGLKQQLADALSGVALPPAVQSKVDAIFAEAASSVDEIDAAIAANTPEQPPAPTPSGA